MGHEKDNVYEGQDDSEYHFSDDQANYEVEGDKTFAPANKATPSKLSTYRRPIIGAVVFTVFILIVYVMLSPSSTPPSTEIVPAKPEKAHALKVALPAATPAVVQQPQAPVATPVPSPVPSAMDKIASLEEQNANQLSQLQADYSQKMNEYDAQNNVLQGKLDDMSVRMASIESNIAKLGQLVEELKAAPPKPAAPVPVMVKMGGNEPAVKAAYTVQAIIPGRAWLKAENGETVTVAEGDTVKGYGKVVKIDPYDGIVNINTGEKTVSLSYGMTAD